MPCGQECCVKVKEVKDLDLNNIRVFIGQQRRHDFQATSPAPAALQAVVARYIRPQPCPGTSSCPRNCPCEVFKTDWADWKTVPVTATYNVPTIGDLVAETTAKRRIGKGIGWCEEPGIALADRFYVPSGAAIALALKPGVELSENDVERLESIFSFSISSAPISSDEEPAETDSSFDHAEAKLET